MIDTDQHTRSGAKQIPSRIQTQWGGTARPFSDFSYAERQAALAAAASLASRITAETGIELFLSYGGLLGAVRTGTLIRHDFDLDFGFLAPSAAPRDVENAARAIINYLTDIAAEVKFESNGHFTALHQTDYGPLSIDFFATWDQDDLFFHYFAVASSPIAHAIRPLGQIELEGNIFPCPNQPEQLLQAIYGPTWRVPDPDFRYALTAKDWAPFEFLFARNQASFWENYYSRRDANSAWNESPSRFALTCASYIGQSQSVLELGAGNGRDGLFFASRGASVTLCDYSSSALELCKTKASEAQLACNTVTLDVTNTAQVRKFTNENRERFDVLYARFFLHAVSHLGQTNILDIAEHCLIPGGVLMAEYRAQPVEADGVTEKFVNGDHYRRMVDHDELLAWAASSGFDMVVQSIGRGLAPYGDEDPVIGQLIVRKPAPMGVPK